MPVCFFDLDGTLTDPKEGIVGSMQYALEKLGVSDIPEELDWIIGPPLHQSFEMLVGKDRAQEGINAYRERYAVTGLYENTLYEGIPALLDGLKETGYPLHVATSKVRMFAVPILEHFALDGYFGQVFGSEPDGTRSNKGELLTYALEQTGVKAEEAVMIGDRKHDILGAKANGMRSVGLLWGYGSREELEEAGADHIVSDLPALAALLRRL